MAFHVNFADGARGVLIQLPPEGSREARVRLDDGREVRLPADLLQLRGDDAFVPLALAELTRQSEPPEVKSEPPEVKAAGGEAPVIVALVAEELDVRRRRLETGVVRITKTVSARDEVVDEPTVREEAHIERVPVNRLVDAPVPVRYENDTMVLSLLEEVLVVEKRLMLTEEVRVTRRQTEVREPQTVTLRREDVSVERIESASPSQPQNS